MKAAITEKAFNRAFSKHMYQNYNTDDGDFGNALFDVDFPYHKWMIEVIIENAYNRFDGLHVWTWVVDDDVEFLVPAMVSRDDCDELLGWVVTTKEAPKGLEQVELDEC
ncbi:MAG: hypothetical protein JKY23_06830 [Nitrospinaceae bacterium]|nr:hypothetical protein [Nitrospinaceae bacterium]